MEITPKDRALADLKPLDPAHFTGRAAARELLATQKPALSTSAIVVRFEPGARNYWHVHGWVQVRGGAPQRIQVGDAVRAEPGEAHWHGAGRSGPLAHIAINVGEARWFEESPAPGD